MLHTTRRALIAALPIAAGAFALRPKPAEAASRSEINRDATAALQNLYASQPRARMLYSKAHGVLIFPKIIKGGFIIGGQTGDGVLRIHGRATEYYNISAASFGLQAGGQVFSYALFFMTAASLSYLRKSDGWALGSGPNIVVLDNSAAASITSTTLTQDVYAIPFGASGLMAGIGIEGSKITHINPGP